MKSRTGFVLKRRTVTALAPVVALVLGIAGLFGVLARVALVYALRSEDAKVGLLSLQWGSHPVLSYFGWLTAVGAVGLLVGLASGALTIRGAAASTGASMLVAGLWLQAAYLVGVHGVFLLCWHGVCRWFAVRAASDPSPAPRLIVTAIEAGGYVVGVAIIVLTVIAYGYASRAALSGDEHDRPGPDA